MDLIFYVALAIAVLIGLISLLKWIRAEDARGRTRNQFNDIVSDIEDPRDS
jgi:hypothetical protein